MKKQNTKTNRTGIVKRSCTFFYGSKREERRGANIFFSLNVLRVHSSHGRARSADWMEDIRHLPPQIFLLLVFVSCDDDRHGAKAVGLHGRQDTSAAVGNLLCNNATVLKNFKFKDLFS